MLGPKASFEAFAHGRNNLAIPCPRESLTTPNRQVTSNCPPACPVAFAYGPRSILSGP